MVLERYEIANRHPDYTVLVAEMSHPSQMVVIKLAGPNSPYACHFARTSALHGIVRANTAVPVPEIIAVDTTYTQWPWRYLIMEYSPGVQWAAALPQMDDAEKRYAYRRLGRAVAELHSLTFSAFGELGDAATPDSPLPYLQTLANRARERIRDEAKAALFLNLLQERASLFAGVSRPCLCHDDLHKHNILFHNEGGEWQLSAILDFDSAYAGHHESDLARLDLWRGMMGPGFQDAYSEVLPISPMYKERRPIHQLLWCLEYEANTPEHHEDTRRLYGQLGIKD